MRLLTCLPCFLLLAVRALLQWINGPARTAPGHPARTTTKVHDVVVAGNGHGGTQFLDIGAAAVAVEGQGFYGIDTALGFEMADWFPYALTRTWHIQSAIFWIATGFLTPYLPCAKEL